jgi:aminopeptidase-like protein
MQTELIGRIVVVAREGEPLKDQKADVVAAYVGDDDGNERLRLVVEVRATGEIYDAPAYYFKMDTSVF